MKKIILFILPATLLIAGCCTKKFCYEETRIHIYLNGFALSEVDTIYTTGYAIGSGFTEVIRPEVVDTVRAVYNSDSTYMLMPNEDMAGVTDGLIHTAEWKVYIPSVNKTLLIDHYGYSTFKCNRCFPAGPRDNKIHTLSTCSVNGVTNYVSRVDIRK